MVQLFGMLQEHPTGLWLSEDKSNWTQNQHHLGAQPPGDLTSNQTKDKLCKFQPNQGQIMFGSEVDTFETPKMHSQEVGRASRRYWEGLGLEAQGALSLKKK